MNETNEIKIRIVIIRKRYLEPFLVLLPKPLNHTISGNIK